MLQTVPPDHPGDSQGSAQVRLTAEELLELRRARLLAERKALEARLAQNALQALLVGLEGRYGPLEGELDLRTGEVHANGREVSREPADDAHAGAPGPA
jgi:hypothetical protein